MKINTNTYNRLVIRQTKDTFTLCVSGDNSIDLSKEANKKFTDSLKKKTEQEKIFCIIKYFLENNKICEINDKTILNYYQELFMVIKSVDKILGLKLNDYENSEIMSVIMNKYFLDRQEFINENQNINQYYLSLHKNRTMYSLDGSSINLCIATSLVKNERLFLEKLIVEKLMQREETSKIVESKFYNFSNDSYFDCDCLKCSDLKIRIPDKLIPFVKKISTECNKKKQLKLEVI